MRAAVAVLLALLVFVVPVHAQPVPHVAAQAANVRATPSADADRVGRLAPGDAVTVIGRSADGEWLRVTGVGQGGTGYVLARLLRPADQAGAAAAPARPSLFAQAVRGDGGPAGGGGTAPPTGTSLFAQAARGGEIEREQAERRRLAAERAAALARQRAEEDERARRAEAQRRADEQAERQRADEERRQREWEEEMEWAEAEAEAEASRLQVLNTIQSIERGFQQQIQQRQAQINQMQQRQAEERRRAEMDRRRAEAERQRREAEARSARERQLAQQQQAQQLTRQDNQARQQAAQRQQEAQRQAALRAQAEARQQAEQRAREEQARQRAEQLRQQLARQTQQNQQVSTLTPYGQRPAGGAPSPAVRTASPAAPPATVTLRETMSYCWNTSGRDNGWFCDGPGQLLLTAWTLREALDYAGCDNSMGQSHQASDSRRVPFRDGFIYYCEHARTPTVHWRDVATLHQVPGTLLERRRSYECRESGPLVCTAEGAVRVFGGR